MHVPPAFAETNLHALDALIARDNFTVVTDVQLTFKLSQNHPFDNRHAVAEQLARQTQQSSRHVAELMRARMPARPGED